MEKPTPKIYVDGEAAKKLRDFIRDLDRAICELCRGHACEENARVGVKWEGLKAAIEETLKVEGEGRASSLEEQGKGDRHGE